MVNSHSRSRSPVRAISTASQPTRATIAPQSRSWSEPTVQEVAPRHVPATLTQETPILACPDCGSPVQLALIPAATEQAPQAPLSRLRAAPEPGPLPDFDGSIERHKRDLICRALEENSGVMTRAAEALGLKYTTFVAMVHRLGVLQEEGAEAE